jgi:hypothetical protein
MAITFDPATQRIILDSASVTATEIYSRWADWIAASDNAKYLPAFRTAGGDDLGGGLSIPPYYFLLNGWRVRPMEANQNLTITGNLFVDGGGVPVVSTLGTFQVNVNYTVPVQAQGISTSGSTGPTAAEIAAQVRTELAAELAQLTKVSKIHGVGVSLVVTPTSRTAGDVAQTVTTVGDTTTVSAA